MRNSGIVQALIGACLITGMAGCTQGGAPTSAPAQGDTRYRVQDASMAAIYGQAPAKTATSQSAPSEVGLVNQSAVSEAQVNEAKAANDEQEQSDQATSLEDRVTAISDQNFERLGLAPGIIGGSLPSTPLTASQNVQSQLDLIRQSSLALRPNPPVPVINAQNEIMVESLATVPLITDRGQVGVTDTSAQAKDDNNVTIKVHDGAFTPAIQTVRPGQTVTWEFNSQGPNTTTSTGSPLGNPRWGSPALSAGLNFRQLFLFPGAYTYRSLTTPMMTGIIVVQP